MQRRFLSCFAVIVALFALFVGNTFLQEKTGVRPSEYPAEWKVIFGQAKSPTVKPNPETVTVKKGSKPDTGAEMVLPCDIILDRDVTMTLRDGTKLYTDILRPANSPANLPAIIGWSPYGKIVPTAPAQGVPPANFSGWAKFEGPDAGFWCNHGYAVVNPDVRGTNYSEGNIQYWGRVDAADGYDFIEWVAKQPWCNGKVALHGASWLGICQNYIAALKPPHLTAIAPFGVHLTDMYRDDVMRGGFGTWQFNKMVTDGLMGLNLVEQPYANAQAYPLMNKYWEDKTVDMKNITIPTYWAGAYGMDSKGFITLGSKQKWFRAPFNQGEWPDQYNPTNQADLLRFFDRYLKGINNGWEATPTARVTVLDPGGVDQENLPFSSWPPVETQYQKFYLDAKAGTLSLQPVTTSSNASYDAATGQATFTTKFVNDTYVIGFPKLRLWVEAAGANDMDIFVKVEKIDNNGNILETTGGYTTKYSGPDGQLRASLRALDRKISTDYLPVPTYEKNEYLSSGQIVSLDIPIANTGMFWHAGQRLQLTVAGDKLKGNTSAINKGTHIIHSGPKYGSYLQLPIVPVKK